MNTVIVLALAALIAFTSSKSSANDIFIEQYGNSFEMSLIQKNGSGNDFDLYSNGDDYVYDIVQDGNNNTLNLTMSGSNPISVTSNQTGDNLGYALTYSCTNPSADGYCYISVTQY